MNTPDPRTSLLKRLGLAWCSCLFLIALFAPRQAEAQGGSAPTLADISKSGFEDTTVTFTAADFTSAFTDPENDSLASITVATLPATGLLKLSGSDVTASQVILLADLGDLTYVPADHENGAKTFTVTASDGTSSSAAATVTMTLTEVNDTPTDIALSASSIAENNAANATVGTLSTTDADAGDTFTYTLVSGTGDTDNASFSISGDALQLTPSADYETQNSYTVRVRTTDAGGLFYEEAFTISISDANDAPTISPAITNGSNQLIYETVNPTRSGSDIVYSVDNAAAFAGASFSRVRYRMELTVSGTPRYAETTFDAWSGLTVADLKVPDGSTPIAIQRNVTDMTVDSNYPGVVNGTAQTGRLEIWPSNYGQGANGGVGGDGNTYDFDDSGFDTGGGYGSFQVHNLSSGPPQTVFAWNQHGSPAPDIGFGNQPAGEPDWTFSNGSLGNTDWKLQISISTPYTFALTEDVTGNLLFTGTPFADDSASLTVTLGVADGEITGNAGTGITVGGTEISRTFTGTVTDLNTYFTTAGKITYLGALNNSSARTLAISISDGTFTSNESSTITLAPVDDTPTDIALSATTIAENNAANATVGTLSTTDADAGDTFTYTLVSGTGDTDNASFSISGDALQLTPSANYETQNSYAVRVRTTDAGGLFYEEAFTISISDVAENPSSISATGGSGTAITSPQLTARMVFADNGSTANLAEADALLAGSNVLRQFTGPIAKVDFADYNTDGSFAGVLPFPGEASIDSIDHFVLQVTGSIHVPTSGQWTFGVRSDDGSRIRIDGVTQLEDDTQHGEEERYVTVTLTAGMHSLDFVFFEGGGGGQVELFSAPGAHSSFNGDFTLITYAPISINEDVPANSLVTTFTAQDEDAGSTATFALVSGTGDDDNASFTLSSGGELTINNSPDYEVKNLYSIRVRATDGTGLTLDRVLEINISKVNQAPTDITLTPSSIEENNAAGAAVGTLAATDPDAGDTFTFTLVAGAGDADNADFSIVGDSLNLNVSADFETKPSYSVLVQAEDAAGATFEKALTVSITNANEAPTALDLPDTSVDENVAANTTVGTFSTTDPDVGDTFTYSLVAGAGDTDNASFNVSGSTLRISASPDFETKASYSIRVRTTDQGSLTLEETFTITVNNLNETATDITLTPSSIQENNAAGAAVGTLAATDPDAGDTFTFTLVAGAGDADNADFSIVGDSLQLDVSADFETKSGYNLRVQAEDAAGATFEKALTVTITDEPEAPTALDLSDTSVDENVAANTIVGTFSTTDPNVAATHTYSLVAGVGDTDNASFNVSGSALRISASPDFETQASYSIRVRTTNQANGSFFYEETFTITVNNLNETATDITLTPSSIEENNAAGAAVGTLAATDPDAGDTFTFTLVAGSGDADNADFSIVGDSLQLDVSADFETKASYNLRVQAEDAAGATFEKALTVTITDEPEAPTALDLSDTSVDENVAANTIVGTFSTTDPNVAATHTYSLVAGADDTDNASFNLSGSALRISASPDFETQASYSIRVRTTNQANGSLFYEETFTITINDINDAPVISGGPVVLTAVYDHEPATVVAVADVLADASVTYLDQDAADAAGVAVVGAAGAGLWEYSADGVSWAPLGSVGNASALLLPGSYSLRYTTDYPGPDGGETASLTLRAWDQTSGVAGTTVNATTQGGSSAFSTGTVSLSLQVQEDDRAPTVTDVEINEVSSYAVFEVTAVAEQLLLLSLGQDANPTTANATVSAFTLETLNAGSTAWVAHNPVDTIEVPASGTLLVRVGTSGEQDDAFEGSEVFTLVAAALSGASNAGTGTIRDDDEGPVFLAANLTATANDPADPGYPVLDDDVVKFIQWGDVGSLADDSLLDATLATADATYPLLFEGLGQGLFDVSLEAGGMAASGLKLIAGQPCWSLTGASGGALTEVSFRFYKPGSTTEFKYLKNVIFRFEDAEQAEQFSGFSYWDGAGTKVTVPWNDSSVFTYSHTPTFTNSNTTVENGATPASQTQAGKWIQVNLSGRQVTGVEFSHRKRVSSAGSVVMTHLAGELAPGALDFGGVFTPLQVGTDPGTQAALPDYRSQATWSGGAPATVVQTPAPGTLLSLGAHAVSLTLDLGSGVVARQGFDITVGDRASVNATPTVTAVTATGASLGGTVSSLGSGGGLERGVVYAALATNADPLLGGTGVTSVIRVGGRGTFTSPVSGLSASTTYAFKAYVTTPFGTTYSDVRFFTTDTGLTFSAGIASLTNQLVRPGETQGFTFSLAESTSAIFSGSGATAGLQWTLLSPVGVVVRSGSGDINFSRALAWGNYRLVVTNPGSAAETFSLNLDTAFPAAPQPDISVGVDATASSGIDIHGPASALQSSVIVSRRAATKTVFFLIDNDGTLADSMRIAGPGPDIRFRITYSLARKNVTAGVIAGVALTPVIDTNDAPVPLSARVAPDRTNPQIMDRVIVNGRRTIVWGSRTFGPKYVTVTASTDADFTDTATFKVDTTP